MLIKSLVRGHRAARIPERASQSFATTLGNKLKAYQASLKSHMGATDLKQLRQLKAKGLSMSLKPHLWAVA